MRIERILVVESDAKIRDLLERFLTGKGYEVVTVESADGVEAGYDALGPDVCLINAVVDDESAEPLCQQVSERGDEVVVVLMGTAQQHAELGPAKQAELGIEHFLTKPFSAAKLVEILGRIEASVGEMPSFSMDGAMAGQIDAIEEVDEEEDDDALPDDSIIGEPVAETLEPGAASESGAALPADIADNGLLAPESIEVAPPSREDVLKRGFGPRQNTQVMLANAELFPAAGPTRSGRAWERSELDADAERHGLPVAREEEARYALLPMEPESPNDPRGIYGEVTLAQLLYNCFRDLFSGRLLLRRGPVLKEVFVVNGRPVNAESNIRSESLGYQLLNQGRITEAQHQESVALMREKGVRQGQALVDLGLLTAPELEEQLRRQVQERLLNCFGWSGAEYGLVYDPNVSENVESFQLNPLVVIFEGIKTSFPIAPLVNHFDDYSRRPVRRTAKLGDYSTMLKEFRQELRVAMLCDGTLTVGELLSASPYGLVDTLRILRALQIIYCVEFDEPRAAARIDPQATGRPIRPESRSRRSPASGEEFPSMSGGRSDSGQRPRSAAPRRESPRPAPAQAARSAAAPHADPAPEPAQPSQPAVPASSAQALDPAVVQQIVGRHAMLETASHYEVFQVPTDAAEALITDHYNRLNLAFRHYVATVGEPELTRMAKEVRQRLVTAYDVLRDHEQRAAYDAITLPVPTDVQVPDLVGAERNYGRGRLCLEAERPGKAARYFELATRQDPHTNRYRMYLGWATFLSVDPEDKKARADAHDMIKSALAEDTTSDDGFVLLAHCYRDTGYPAQAIKFYKQALTINRSNAAASRELARLEKGEQPAASRDTGIFGKLFGR